MAGNSPVLLVSTLIVSAISAFASIAAWWVNHEKLRLDLYNRRFDVYRRTLAFYHELEAAEKGPPEQGKTAWVDSPELRQMQLAFISAYRESQFLFDDGSRIFDLLKQMHSDSIGMIGHIRYIIPNVSSLGPIASIDAYNDYMSRLHRVEATIPELEKRMSPYLNFHRLSFWNALQEGAME